MRVALHSTIEIRKKEPLVELIGRIRQAFLDAGLAEPLIRFTLVDSALKKGAAIDRVLKRYPEMERFLTFSALMPGTSESRRLTNATTGEAADFATLQAITAGVPRSYPFIGVWTHFHAPAFGERLIGLPKMGNSFPGVLIVANWLVTGHQRALSVYTVAEADEKDKKLPPNPEPVDAVIKACGKVRRIDQVPIRAPGGGIVGCVPPANAEAVKVLVDDYRARLTELVERARLPHDLPPAAEILIQHPGVVSGPRKPALQAAFKPMGYSCRGGSGEFHLTRKTSGNLTVELYLDVGTWSHDVSALFLVQGAGFRASLAIPVSPREVPPRQYPIGDAVQWQRIVDNLAAMVGEMDRSLVPEVEQAAGPSPAWYQPS
jgi:hypothetical protein